MMVSHLLGIVIPQKSPVTRFVLGALEMNSGIERVTGDFMRNPICFSCGKKPNLIPHKFSFALRRKRILRNDGILRLQNDNFPRVRKDSAVWVLREGAA